MQLEKIWINNKANEHNFILFNDETIYRRKAKTEQFTTIEDEVNQGIINDKFIGIPMSYISSIEFKDDNKNLKIKYGKESEDDIEIGDNVLRKEIFDYLKTNTEPYEVTQQKPPILGRIRAPLIALTVVAGMFIYVFSIIDGLNNGYEYEATGPGLGALVLVLAQLGLIKNLFIFLPLALIAVYRIWINYKDDTEIHYLYY